MIIYQCTPTRRIVQHDDEHYDIETLFTINTQPGVVEEVWAVIECGITGEDEMPPRRPIELVQASQDCAEAWSKRDAMIDAGDTVGVKAMDLTCDILDERYQKIYREWQILGGTSNIESIALPLPAEHYETIDESIDTGLITLNDHYRPATMGDEDKIPF